MQSSVVVMLSRNEVPVFLRRGAFYQNLDSSDEERFEVPTNRYKAYPSIKNSAELILLLQTASFWGLEEPPPTVASYVIRNREMLNAEYLQSEFPEYATFLANSFHLSIQLPERVIVCAIEVGMGLNVVKRLYKHDGFHMDSSALLVVAKHDNLSCFKWLLALGFKWNQGVIMCMLEHGSMRCLRHAVKNGLSLSGGAVAYAAHFERLEMVKFLLSSGVKTELDALKHVLHKGNVEIMRVLRQAGCEWPHTALGTLIIYNHLEGLIFAHKDGLELTPKWCVLAAKHGRLSCLEYLHSQGCPWDEEAPHMAVRGGHLDCLKFADQHGCPMHPMLAKLAFNYGKFAVVPYCMWHGAIDIDVIVCCVAWVCVTTTLGLWWTGQCTDTALIMAILFVVYSTINLFDMVLGSKIPFFAQYFVSLSVMIDVGWDICMGLLEVVRMCLENFYG